MDNGELREVQARETERTVRRGAEGKLWGPEKDWEQEK